MPAIRTILCPTDFSDASHHAFEHAIAIAGYYRARIVSVHAVSPAPLLVPGYAPIGGPYFPPDLVGNEIDQAKAQAVEEAGAAGAAGLPIDVVVRSGGTVRLILECAEETGADLIVLGTHGAGGFEHLVLGSVTEKVMRKAACPVLTVPPRAQATSNLPFERMLCPIDFSGPSLAAFELACSLARESGAQLTMLHVVDWSHPSGSHGVAHFEVPEFARYLEDDARTRLSQMAADVAGTGLAPVIELAYGRPHRQVIAAAEAIRADLIVMGVHGQHALNTMLFGSTTNHVVRSATCPVLTLRG
jgi:nucleotide-binding universal stress UspA family protein